MSYRGELHVHIVVIPELAYPFVVKGLTVVHDQRPRYPKPIKYRRPEEPMNGVFVGLLHRLGFYPLGEVVDCDDEELLS